MIELIMDVNLLEMILVLSLLYMAGWSVLDPTAACWNCRQVVDYHHKLDSDIAQPLFIPKYFLFTIIKRKIPEADQQNDDEDEIYHFSINP
ncbi:hypothetical protein ACE1TI_07770 [Alteribacillus sp. JSM 102045]|uniref:hypothetical protein n=1 Tax=Alteribacillus sp. JSM 102045 TaxID=1562101 RepID=UPI0035C16783